MTTLGITNQRADGPDAHFPLAHLFKTLCRSWRKKERVTYWAERNWNSDVYTDTQLMLDTTQNELAALSALPDADTIYAICAVRHEAGYQSVMQDIENLPLEFWLTLLAGSIPSIAHGGFGFSPAPRAFLRGRAKA